MTPHPTAGEVSGVRGGVDLGYTWVDLVTRQIQKMILADININTAIFRCKTVFSTECENTKLTNTMQIFGLRPARLHDHFIYYKIVTI